ncbi:V-type ATPase 116 kDa subunit [Pyrolobus fumarii 1A]|uniref:A-type ATP synthase subunit I n=1 Tax=Pyrolobus fumarii (strain DSM 11204 / 1A) TaxID=694429 RepID=G0EE16_PYRF1|nr:V-type ATPase 116kDa subunit family protein [Pyrolobus fumarii]AEM37932.1 V-type ATPase 116 kDa subunit [Pyrolobus fumarii 1A]
MLIARGAAEVTILVPRDKLTSAVKAILESGAFHPKPIEAGEEAATEKGQVQRLLSEAENLAQRIRAYLTSVGELPEPGEAHLGEVRDWVSKAEEVIREAEELDSKLDPVLKKLTELRTPGSELAEAAEVAKAYSWLDFDLSQLRDLKHLRVRLLRVPHRHVERFVKLAEEEPIYVIVAEDYEPLNALVIAIYPEEYEVVINHLAGETDASEVVLPSNIPQNLAKAAEHFAKLEEELVEEIKRNVPKLKELLAKLLTVREALRVLLGSLETRLFTVLSGYVPHNEVKKFANMVVEATGNTAIVTASGYVRMEEEVETPAIVKVPKPLKPFEMLMSSYGFPRPRAVSPLILMAITFPLIFGMAFPDLGHGLVLFLLGLYMRKRGEFLGFARGEGVRQLGTLLLYLGFTAMVFGFLAAEFFGPLTSEWLIHLWCSMGYDKPPYATPLYAAHVLHSFEELSKEMGPIQALNAICPALAQKVLEELGPNPAPEQVKHFVEAYVGANIMTTAVYFSMYVSLLLGTLLLTLTSIFGLYTYIVMGEKAEAVVSGLSKTLIFGGVFIAFLSSLAFLPRDAIRLSGYLLALTAGLTEVGGRNVAESLSELVRMHGGDPGIYLGLIQPLMALMIYSGLAIAFIGKIVETVHHGGGIGAALGNAALELFDLLLIAMGNTLSFLRIFALALAHSSLMYGFYAISLLAGPALPIIYVLANLLVIGMEAIVAFAHTLRLHYYEMFSKFFFATGKPFQPVRAYARIG